jgi:tetratricopeptide (TPR) repeat protein
MRVLDPADPKRYAAFISYSQANRAAARWLHRAIESYRIPRRLLRRNQGRIQARDRLAPVFLDREELSSSPSLGDAVRSALERSDFLIVVCSPSAAASRWVDEEVRAFKALGRSDRILCLIVDGEPMAAERGRPAAEECFPPALRYEVAGGQLTAQRANEPLAADLRAGADGRRAARLKLIAGLLGANLDDLRQREQARWQRRLVLVGATATAGCLVLAGLALAAWMARNEAEGQRQLAEQKSLTARRTADFMIALFQVADPSEARGNSVTAREILDRGAAQVDESLRDEPTVRAELSTTLGEVYRGLGLYGSAFDLLSKARALGQRDATAWVRTTLSLAELELQRGNDARSDQLFSEADQRYASVGGKDPAIRAQVLLGRGGAAAVLERADEARERFERALALGTTHGLAGVTAEALEGLAMTNFYAGDFKAAESFYGQALDARITLSGATHPKVSESLNGLAATAYMRGDGARAESYWQRVLTIDRRLLGSRHPDLATTMNNLGRLWLERREFSRAAAILDEAVSILAAQQSETHEDMMFAYSNLALAHMGRGQYRAAAPLLERALKVAAANDHALQGPIMVYQADLDCRAGRYGEGLGRLTPARPLVGARYREEPWRGALLRSVEAGCLDGLRRFAEAQRLIEGSTPVILARWPASTAFGRDALERAIHHFTSTDDAARVAQYRGEAQSAPLARP